MNNREGFTIPPTQSLTRVAPHVDLEAAGLVVRLVAAGEGAGEVSRLSEVSAVVREQGAEGDEGFLTA